MLTGTCHCGQVRVVVPRPPEYGNACQCSICRRYGVIWGYYRPDEVSIDAAPGARVSYSWGDRALAFGRCAVCGTVTDWQEIRAGGPDRMAVNLRVFEPDDVADVPIRKGSRP